MKADTQFAPAAFNYQHSESKQTAHATIGKGEIIVRNAPNSSLSGLNRDVATSITEKTTVNTNTKIDPLFDYVDTVITAKNIPFTVNEVFRFKHDPGTFLKDAGNDFLKNLPWNAGKQKKEVPHATSTLQPQPTTQAGRQITVYIPKYVYLFILFYCVLIINGCGTGNYWWKNRHPDAHQTNGWMAGGKWNRCADGDYAGRHINSFTETKTCVPDPKGGRICTFYYYSNDGVYNLKTWYQQRYDMYVDDNGYIKGCVVRRYRLGIE